MQGKAVELLKLDAFMGEGALLKSWSSACVCILLQEFCNVKLKNNWCKSK